jgi:hypothetical protein
MIRLKNMPEREPMVIPVHCRGSAIPVGWYIRCASSPGSGMYQLLPTRWMRKVNDKGKPIGNRLQGYSDPTSGTYNFWVLDRPFNSTEIPE